MLPTDYQLLQRFAHGNDEQAFAELLVRHGGLIQRACQRVLGDPASADDAFQATTWTLAQQAQSLVQKGEPLSLAGWLHTVAVQKSLLARRRGKTRRRHEEALARIRRGYTPVDTRGDALRVLHEEIGALPDQLQAPLVLCCLEGQTRTTAAQNLGIGYATVRRRLDEAKRELLARLVRRGIAVSAAALAALLEQAQAAPVEAEPLTVLPNLQDFPVAVDALVCGTSTKRGGTGMATSCKTLGAGFKTLGAGLLAAAVIGGAWAAAGTASDEGRRTPVAAKEKSTGDATAAQARAEKAAAKKRAAQERVTQKRAAKKRAAEAARSPQSPGNAGQKQGNSVFKGVINDNGQVTEFNDPADMPEVQRRIEELQKNFPGMPALPKGQLPQFKQNGAQGQAQAGGMAGGQANGQAGGQADLRGMLDQIEDLLKNAPANAVQNFQGIVNENGQITELNDPAEAQAVLDRLRQQFPAIRQ